MIHLGIIRVILTIFICAENIHEHNGFASAKEMFLTCTDTCRHRCDCCTYNVQALKYLYINVTCDVSSIGTVVKPDVVADDDQYVVNLQRTCLFAIPDNICEFPTINVLNLPYNMITEIPDLSCLKGLVYLRVSNNNIEILKTGIFDSLRQLRYINLSNNNIMRIEPGVFHTGLVSLKTVNLQYNKLTEVDFWFFNITHRFCSFDLRYNHITTLVNEAQFKFDFTKSYGPGFVDFQFNKFRHWPEAIFRQIGFSDLRNVGFIFQWGIDLRDNLWLCDCKMHFLLQLVYNFPRVIIRKYMEVKCNSPPNLNGSLATNVKLTDLVCNVTDLCPPNCFCQDQPALSRFVVDCRNLGLTEMPKELPRKRNIHLYLQNNSIEIIYPASYLQRTVYIDISDNNIRDISPAAIDNLDGLIYLNLDNNKLQYLPENIQILRNTEIHISDNRLICSCSNIWISEWFDTKPHIDGISDVTCVVSRGRSYPIQAVNEDILKCEDNSWKIISIVLGILACIIIIILIVCIYYRYEILTLYYLKLAPKLHKMKEMHQQPTLYDIFISCNDDDDNDRLWVQTTLIPYFTRDGLKSYISFRDGLPGEIKVETNINTIHKSCLVIGVLSESYIADQSTMFELNEIYHHMIKNRNGKLIIIKRGEFLASLINNKYIKSLFTLKLILSDQDDNLLDKISKQVPERRIDDQISTCKIADVNILQF